MDDLPLRTTTFFSNSISVGMRGDAVALVFLRRLFMVLMIVNVVTMCGEVGGDQIPSGFVFHLLT